MVEMERLRKDYEFEDRTTASYISQSNGISDMVCPVLIGDKPGGIVLDLVTAPQ